MEDLKTLYLFNQMMIHYQFTDNFQIIILKCCLWYSFSIFFFLSVTDIDFGGGGMKREEN